MTQHPERRRYEELLEKNRRYLWNPFTQMREFLADEPIVVESADGVRLRDVRGREYYDGNSSLWLNVHGHRRSEIDRAIVEQLGRAAHTTLLGLSSVPAIELAERLVGVAPASLGKAYFAGDGASAVEAALEDRGVLGVAIRPPSVPAGGARIRFSLKATHDDAVLERALAALGEAWSMLTPSSKKGADVS